MPLPSSGPIRMGADVNVELGNAATAQISLGQSSVRSLYGVASGAIRLAADGYGKSSAFAFTISTNQQEANLRTLALAAGWNGTSSVTATVSAGVYIWSNNTGTAALTINGSWPGGVTLVNNGYIIGRGGNGGTGYWNAPSSGAMAGNAGGPAISLGINATITNNSGAYIAGGGGGGAGAGIVGFGVTGGGGGGGAGGGTGGSVINAGGGSSTTAGGAGGGLGASGSNGSLTPNAADGSGGGGGRILPGTGGAGGVSGNLTGKGGGSGGGGGHGDIYYTSGSGGAGGSAGSVGGNATASDGGNGGGGGGWGASGGTGSTGSASVGGGGKAIALNGFTATRSGAGTTYGAVS